MPDDRGRCVWCLTQTGAPAPAAPDAPAAERTTSLALRKGDDGYGPVCPACGGGKTVGARRCWSCRMQSGHRGRDLQPRARRRAVSIEVLEECRVLYAQGLSFRQVADVVLDRTGYKTAASAAEGIYRAFKALGWPARPQAAVTAARNFRHGRGGRDRDEGAYRRFLREQRGAYQPRCQAVKSQAPGKGRPCSRPAMRGSEFCASHDPARRAFNVVNLAFARAEIQHQEVAA